MVSLEGMNDIGDPGRQDNTVRARAVAGAVNVLPVVRRREHIAGAEKGLDG